MKKQNTRVYSYDCKAIQYINDKIKTIENETN